MTSYRPVSNLTVLSKMIERSVLKQLTAYTETHHLFDPNQSAYRSSHSTETLLTYVTDLALKNLDNNSNTALLMLDLSAAFDTFDHDIMLHTLEYHFGIRGSALRWFRSYLSDRSQSVTLSGYSSPSVEVSYGAPQGSVLAGPFFCMFMRPLQHVITKHQNILYQSYADDSQLMFSFKTVNSADVTKLSHGV